ncbi:hypothetical protein UFOVP1639_7 [uncultured Caudovirales phage]|uniref:Uncharacterized protein n=1 Tax=uncultured Caudovirales phage TaxID=2100421 RepID=A0A6J5SZF8_9CAUD|nr:hypothetical protein UFOVP1639_7 [uncultured Caudovirales phage]
MLKQNLFVITVAGTQICKKEPFSFIAIDKKRKIIRTNVLATASKFSNEIDALRIAEFLQKTYKSWDAQVVKISN